MLRRKMDFDECVTPLSCHVLLLKWCTTVRSCQTGESVYIRPYCRTSSDLLISSSRVCFACNACISFSTNGNVHCCYKQRERQVNININHQILQQFLG